MSFMSPDDSCSSICRGNYQDTEKLHDAILTARSDDDVSDVNRSIAVATEMPSTSKMQQFCN